MDHYKRTDNLGHLNHRGECIWKWKEKAEKKKDYMALEKILKKNTIPIQGDLILVVRRVVMYGREYVDVRFVQRIYGSPRYSKKGVRLRVEHLNKLIMALIEMTKVEEEVRLRVMSE